MNKLTIKFLIIIFLALFSSLLYSQSKSLIDQMIDASISGDEEKVIQIKSSIESTTKLPKGDRKTARTLNDKALFELNAGNFDAAVELLTKAYETDPSDTEVASNLGYALIKSGNIKQAEAPFNHSIMLNPNRTDAWANLSEFFADKGDFRSSTAVLNIAYLLSTNKGKTRGYFQKFLIDNQENKTLVAAATEALRDEGIKPISESVISQNPDEVTTSNNQGSEVPNNALSPSTYISKSEPKASVQSVNESSDVIINTSQGEETTNNISTPSTHTPENEPATKITPPIIKKNKINEFSQMINDSDEYRQMNTFMGMDIDEVIQIFYFFCVALLLKGMINLFFLLALSNSHDETIKLRNKIINRRINLTIFVITVILFILFTNNNDTKEQSNIQRDVSQRFNNENTLKNVDDQIEHSDPTKKIEKLSQQLYIGDTFKTQKFAVTITSFNILTHVGSEYFEESVSEGGIYVAVQWKYKNISTGPISAFEQPSLVLIDSSGTTYEADLGANMAFATQVHQSTKVVSNVNPGITISDAEVFEVSSFQFDTAKWHLLIKVDDKDFSVLFENPNENRDAIEAIKAQKTIEDFFPLAPSAEDRAKLRENKMP